MSLSGTSLLQPARAALMTQIIATTIEDAKRMGMNLVCVCGALTPARQIFDARRENLKSWRENDRTCERAA